MFYVLVGLLTGAGEGVAPPTPQPQLGGGWGFYPAKRRKTKFDEEVEAAAKALDEVTEAVKADIEPETRPAPKRRVLVVDELIALPPIDASGAIEAARQAYFDALSKDDEDAINAILAVL